MEAPGPLPPLKEVYDERRNPSQVQRHYGEMPLRQHLSDPFHPAGNLDRGVFPVPPVLYRQAEAHGYRWSCGALQEEMRHVARPPAFTAGKGILSMAKSPSLFFVSFALQFFLRRE